MTPRVELENKVGIVNQATMDYDWSVLLLLYEAGYTDKLVYRKHHVQLSVLFQFTVSIWKTIPTCYPRNKSKHTIIFQNSIATRHSKRPREHLAPTVFSCVVPQVLLDNLGKYVNLLCYIELGLSVSFASNGKEAMKALSSSFVWIICPFDHFR